MSKAFYFTAVILHLISTLRDGRAAPLEKISEFWSKDELV